MSTVLVPGAVVAGRYTVGERLGAGGMGVVHRARDTVLQRDVALKQVLLPDDGDPGGSDGAGPAATRRLRREAAVAAQLHHGRIVTVFDVLELDGGPLLVMEYVPAESLAALLLRSGPLPSGVAARIGAQVAEALAALHENGIVHRDVKPANVLVSADGPVKLTDFGIALIPTRHAHTVGALGTPAYFAPETARGADPAPPADVYALGATLRVLTEGEPPYGWAEDSPLALIRRIAEAPVPAPSGRGPVPELLTAMTATDPAARPTAAEAARALWALADRPEPVPAAPAPGDGSPTRPDDVTAGPDHGVADPRPRRRGPCWSARPWCSPGPRSSARPWCSPATGRTPPPHPAGSRRPYRPWPSATSAPPIPAWWTRPCWRRGVRRRPSPTTAASPPATSTPSARAPTPWGCRSATSSAPTTRPTAHGKAAASSP
ncbi:protein kinase domain-containing protein [Pseudonocardia alni]|uniref:serine/threonine-protein kinase n=1 Tax=Pseudonocardia alni TaxID=33907 RepID=UPI0027A8577A|nr:protein kinase [Pseudonocardia alni]